MALASAPMFVATLVTGAMSGLLLDQFCPEKGPRHSETMWLVIGCISFTSPLLLFLFKDQISETTLVSSEVLLSRPRPEGKGLTSPSSLLTSYGATE